MTSSSQTISSEAYNQFLTYVSEMEGKMEQEVEARTPGLPLPSEAKRIFGILALVAVLSLLVILLALYGLLPYADISLPIILTLSSSIMVALSYFQKKPLEYVLAASVSMTIIAVAIMFVALTGLLSLFSFGYFLFMLIGGAYLLIYGMLRLKRITAAIEYAYEFYMSVRKILEDRDDDEIDAERIISFRNWAYELEGRIKFMESEIIIV